jgi:hypothetical protein
VDKPLGRIAVGVVVERRKAESRWIDFLWRPVAVLPGEAEAAPWTVLADDGEVVRFFAGSAEIALYRTETEYYRDNLRSGTPLLWVVLRPTGGEPPYRLAAVTADPNEGEGFTQVGDDLVESLPMPEAVWAIVESFVAEHHVEHPFVKRKRDRADPDALARRTPSQKGGKS